MQNITSEILINAYQVTRHRRGDAYEFILNDALQILECVKVKSRIRGTVAAVQNVHQRLEGMLFELNHVRVNPHADNTLIIDCLTEALSEIGVRVSNPPRNFSMAACYKPLGEISDNVRFYLNQEGNLVFLSPAMRPRLVYSSKA